MRKSITIGGKRVKLEGNRASVLLKGIGVVSIQVDQFISLSEFLKIGRTAEEIKKSYGLSSVVAAKRLVKEAQTAGVKISKYTSDAPRGVGRQPNIYQLTDFVVAPLAPVASPVKPSMPPAHESPAEVRAIDEQILEALKGLSARVGAIEGRTVLQPHGAKMIPQPPSSNGHPR